MATFHPSKIMFIAFTFLSAITSSLLAQQSVQTVKIGVYDSRAIAIAYANSEIFKSYFSNLKAEYNKAKEENNKERISELEKEGPFQQKILHQQSFSNGTVSNIIEKIKDKLPNIAKQAGVSIIVSKWELAYQDSSLNPVDLTDQIVMLFNPNEKTLNWIEGLKKQTPVPIDKLKMEANQ